MNIKEIQEINKNYKPDYKPDCKPDYSRYLKRQTKRIDKAIYREATKGHTSLKVYIGSALAIETKKGKAINEKSHLLKDHYNSLDFIVDFKREHPAHRGDSPRYYIIVKWHRTKSEEEQRLREWNKYMNRAVRGK